MTPFESTKIWRSIQGIYSILYLYLQSVSNWFTIITELAENTNWHNYHSSYSMWKYSVLSSTGNKLVLANSKLVLFESNWSWFIIMVSILEYGKYDTIIFLTKLHEIKFHTFLLNNFNIQISLAFKTSSNAYGMWPLSHIYTRKKTISFLGYVWAKWKTSLHTKRYKWWYSCFFRTAHKLLKLFAALSTCSQIF